MLHRELRLFYWSTGSTRLGWARSCHTQAHTRLTLRTSICESSSLVPTKMAAGVFWFKIHIFPQIGAGAAHNASRGGSLRWMDGAATAHRSAIVHACHTHKKPAPVSPVCGALSSQRQGAMLPPEPLSCCAHIFGSLAHGELRVRQGLSIVSMLHDNVVYQRLSIPGR